ncbi:hypothetical protein BGZ73_004463 [Actinomortierella ambigua]|nr:hypothetical protein BGZ73_004463 [Actinomortierella ambigua]
MSKTTTTAAPAATPRKKQLKGAGRDQFQEFIKFFQDPDNAQDLIRQIKAAPPFDPSEDHNAHGKKRKSKDSDDDASGEKPYKGPSSKAIAFRALQLHLDYSNQQEVFLAVYFLNRNLPKALEHRDEFLSKVVMFKALAAHFDATEPMLKGVTGMALLSLHDRVVAKRKELMETLKSDALDASQKLEWRDTKLSDAVRSLIGLDDQLSEAFAQKEGERKYKRQKSDKPGSSTAATLGSSPSSSGKKHDGHSGSEESENEPLASRRESIKAAAAAAATALASASSSAPKPAVTSNADKAKDTKKEKKDKKEKKENQSEQIQGNSSEANHTASAQKAASTSAVAADSKSSGFNQTVVDMLLDRIKTLEDEVKELRRKTYDNGDAIKELKWQHVTK